MSTTSESPTPLAIVSVWTFITGTLGVVLSFLGAGLIFATEPTSSVNDFDEDQVAMVLETRPLVGLFVLTMGIVFLAAWLAIHGVRREIRHHASR